MRFRLIVLGLILRRLSKLRSALKKNGLSKIPAAWNCVLMVLQFVVLVSVSAKKSVYMKNAEERVGFKIFL